MTRLFFSNRNYEVIWGDKGEVRSFEDRWSGGIDHYIAWLTERVAEMHRLLKPNGSILIHCDYHANAYIRVYILDKIFGYNNFRNELIWYYNRWTNVSNQFQNMHDFIFWYSKGNKYTFNKNGKEPSDSQMKKFQKGWDQNVVKGTQGNRLTQYIVYDVDKFQQNCKPKPDARIVYRLTKDLKVAPSDVIEIPIINSQAYERIGYPTQKPESLLDKLIYTLSNENDIVLDPFVGGGTTVAVADRLNRKWIGIDQSVAAVKVTEMRLNNKQDLFSLPFSVTLHKYDYHTLFNQNPFEFEKWIVEQFGGMPNYKQRSDGGFDGKTREGIPIQVKQSENIGKNVIKNFYSSCVINEKQITEKQQANNEPIGYIIAFSFGTGAVQEVAKLKNQENIIIKLIKVDEIIPIAKKPKLMVKIEDLGIDLKGLRIIELIANAESESGIEFYSWDFDYNEEEKIFKADIMLDKEGKQSYKFKPGTHTIAVKAIDNEGLEAIEVVKIKVNGVVERE